MLQLDGPAVAAVHHVVCLGVDHLEHPVDDDEKAIAVISLLENGLAGGITSLVRLAGAELDLLGRELQHLADVLVAADRFRDKGDVVVVGWHLLRRPACAPGEAGDRRDVAPLEALLSLHGTDLVVEACLFQTGSTQGQGRHRASIDLDCLREGVGLQCLVDPDGLPLGEGPGLGVDKPSRAAVDDDVQALAGVPEPGDLIALVPELDFARVGQGPQVMLVQLAERGHPVQDLYPLLDREVLGPVGGGVVRRELHARPRLRVCAPSTVIAAL
mmetsp:Transcript_26798/g.77436  ORF Transcript_26798/g.77436 Transcript_26798/m.77436 type:complete len:272 (+) Transcript_26798:1648-2463(+)